MPSSPTLTEFNNKLKDRGFKHFYSINVKSYSYLIVIYPIIVLYALLVGKPKIILKENIYDKDDKDEISYDKLIIWYILLQIPVFFYVFIRMSEKSGQ
jgi:hypothetical protein